MTHSSHGDVLHQAFQQWSPANCDHFRPWTYDIPLAIRPETHRQMQRIQHLYLKCIRHAADHYLDRYFDLMPLPDRVVRILELCRHRPYRPGTYRTDFLVGKDNHIRLIETTCRFALNGFFQANVFEHMAKQYVHAHPGIRSIDPHTPFFGDFIDYFGSFDRFCVLTGENRRWNETKFFLPIFTSAGLQTEEIAAADVPRLLHRIDNSAVIGELSHEEWCTLPDDAVSTLVAANLLNDVRTVFLIHDKRFFALLQHDGFMRNALTPEERAEFQPYLTPTYSRHITPEVWPEARSNKELWIMKPYNQGRSIDVFAGALTPESDWKELFDSGRADSMVLQEYIPQRTFRGTIRGTPHEDYAAGTLLFFEDGFYGTGLFRASSHPVTNRVDNHKIATLVTPDFNQFEADNVL